MKVTISGITLKDEKTIHLLVAGDAKPNQQVTFHYSHNILTVEHKRGAVQLPVIKFNYSGREGVTFYCYDLDGKTVLYFNGTKFTSNPKEFEDTIDKWALQDLDEIIEMMK